MRWDLIVQVCTFRVYVYIIRTHVFTQFVIGPFFFFSSRLRLYTWSKYASAALLYARYSIMCLFTLCSSWTWLFWKERKGRLRESCICNGLFEKFFCTVKCERDARGNDFKGRKGVNYDSLKKEKDFVSFSLVF